MNLFQKTSGQLKKLLTFVTWSNTITSLYNPKWMSGKPRSSCGAEEKGTFFFSTYLTVSYEKCPTHPPAHRYHIHINSSVSKASIHLFVGFPHNKKRKAWRRRIRQKLCNQILKAPGVKLHYHRKHQGGHRLSLAPSLLPMLWAHSKDPLTPSLREYLSRGSISWCGPPSQWSPWMAELPPCCSDPVKNPKFCISMHDLTYVSSALNPQQKLEISRQKLLPIKLIAWVSLWTSLWNDGRGAESVHTMLTLFPFSTDSKRKEGASLSSSLTRHR